MFFNRRKSAVLDYIESFSVYVAVFVLIYMFLARPTLVYGPSMQPNFYTGERLITDELSYRFFSPQRGNVVVLISPVDSSQELIKRIIGLPGETIKIQNSRVYINGALLPEPYLPPSTYTVGKVFLSDGAEYTIPQDSYFVMGDNRDVSLDSRYFGPVKHSQIIGKAFFKYWPPADVGLVVSP